MDALVSRALMIRLSLQPSPDSETSAFSNIRAFSNRCAELFPFRISASSRSRSSALNRTTYLFTEISFAAMIASVVHTADEANHQILSIWLKRATSPGLSWPAARPSLPATPAQGFVRLAPLLGCSEKSPRQGARAVRHGVDHPSEPEGDRSQ